MTPLTALLLTLAGTSFSTQESWIAATDETSVRRSGSWAPARHRYAAAEALASREDGAALEVGFRGRGLSVVFDTLTVPSYGKPELGLVDVSIDDGEPRTVLPRAAADEVVLARGLRDGDHRVRLVHRRSDDGIGVRILGFRVLPQDSGDLAFVVTGESNGQLVDVRAVLAREGRTVRDTLLRNWMTGEGRLAGLPAGEGYSLEVRASGWKTLRREGITIRADEETRLVPIHLPREWDVPDGAVRFPAPGRPSVARPGGTFRFRLQAYQAEVGEVKVVRRRGPAVVSRVCRFQEDPAAAYYYFKEGIVTLPADLPPGLYDLEAAVGNARRVSPRSIMVVTDFPRDPVFLGVGHLDTWGQNQAEYLERVADLANLLAPDMVLVSNEVNAAYVAGALHRLEMPFVINFGNHQVHGHERWFGDPVGVVDFGPGLSILNFGREWAGGCADADALLAARAKVPVKVVNAFEHDAPVAEFLDRHRVQLLHDGHGPGARVMTLGATPTLRVVKPDSESFRVIRFKDGRPVSFTYRGEKEAAIPFPRKSETPVRVRIDGTTAWWTNDLAEDFANGRLVFVLPKGTYRADGGRVESAVESDDGKYVLLTVRVDLAAKSTGSVKVGP